MSCPTATPRPGFSLVELVVALTLLSVGVLALVGSAINAQRSFAIAEAEERGVRAAALVIDSLLREAAPADGERDVYGARVSWVVSASPHRLEIVTTVAVPTPSGSIDAEYHSSRAPAAVDTTPSVEGAPDASDAGADDASHAVTAGATP